jgi:hypothetical protein
MKKLLWLVAMACASLTRAYSQTEIPVDMFTGTPSIGVPFGSVSDHGVADAFGLSYNARGVAIKAASGFYGIGWNLQGGGQVVRDVRGLPDDYFGQGTDLRRGWLHNQSNVQTAAFGNISDATSTTCTDELADYNQLNAFQYIVDTEPDMFYYDAGGYSGAFVFDNATTPTIRLMPHAAVRIVPQFTGTTLSAFTITTPGGNVFTYSLAAQENRQALRYSTSTAYVDFLKTDYALYEKAAAYNYAWKLVTVVSPEGGQINYTYADEVFSETARYDPDNTIVVRQRNNSPVESYVGRYLFRWETLTHVKRLVSVESQSGTKIEFGYTVVSTNPDAKEKAMLTRVSLIDMRRPADGVIKQFKLEYDRIKADTLNTYLPGPNDQSVSYDYTNFRRSFLRYVTEYAGCEQLPPHEFTYNNPGLLPLPHSLSVDFWGYYNGRSNTHRTPKLYIYPALAPAERYRVFPMPAYSGENYVLDGANLTVNAATVKYGTLETVHYPSGARTVLEYEPNEFYDATAGQSFYGGGVRIKKITQEDGLNVSTAIVKSFAYTEGNKSSGRIGYMPSYAIPTTQYMNADSVLVSHTSLVSAGMNPWIYLTARLDVDMGSIYHSEATAVRYRRVTVARPGAGYAVLDYAVPGGWGSTGVGAWIPTEDKFARSAACAPVLLFPQASAGIFPHARYPNIQGEGLLMRKREYNEQGVPVRRIEYTYQDVYTTGTEANKVWGVAYQKFSHAEGGYYFGKYFLLTGVTQAMATETETVLDEQDTLRRATVLRESFYESANHRFPTRTRVTGGDGTVYTTYMKYPQDYGVVPAGADKPAEMIGKLQTANRVASPLESYSTVLRPGGTAQVQSASLATYHDFGGTYPLPHEQRVLTGTPLTSFTFSSINATTKKLTYHANYEVVSTAGAYTPTGQLKYQTGQDRIGATTGWGYGNTLPVVAVSQAAPGEFAFSDFETTTGHEFSAQPSTPVAGGHTGLQAVRADVALVKTITKTTDRYRVTGWLKSTATPVTLSVIISQAGGTTIYTTTSIPLAATGGNYIYFERIIPVTASVTSFDVKVQGSFTPPGNGDYPLLDDIAYYPEHATLVSSTHAIPYGVNAVTARNKTAYSVYDRLGRVQRTLDQDRNIVQQMSYQMATPLRPVAAEAYFSYLTPTLVNVPIRFTALDICANATYTWSFGATGTSVSHAFSTPGTQTVILTVTWPGGQSTYQTTVNIKALD